MSFAIGPIASSKVDDQISIYGQSFFENEKEFMFLKEKLGKRGLTNETF